jgi:hypothetical protein
MTTRTGADHQHSYLKHAMFEDAPVPGGCHTHFLMLRCECGAIEFFPHSNFLLTVPSFQADIRTAIQESGFYLVEPARDGDPRVN